jgi:hypothetical protein
MSYIRGIINRQHIQTRKQPEKVVFRAKNFSRLQTPSITTDMYHAEVGLSPGQSLVYDLRVS